MSGVFYLTYVFEMIIVVRQYCALMRSKYILGVTDHFTIGLTVAWLFN